MVNELNRSLSPQERAEGFKNNLSEHIIYEDGSIMAVNKPALIPMYGASITSSFGLVEAISKRAGPDIHPVHRLDRDTSGLVLLGKTKGVRRNLCAQIRRHEVTKIYLALVEGEWKFPGVVAGIIAPLTGNEPVVVDLSGKGKSAATSFWNIATFENENGKNMSLMGIGLVTGRTHQIRAHLSHLGYPIVGDRIYNTKPDGAHRQLLHAHNLMFIHPWRNKEVTMRLSAPLPNDFRQALSNLDLIKYTSDYIQIMGWESVLLDSKPQIVALSDYLT